MNYLKINYYFSKIILTHLFINRNILFMNFNIKMIPLLLICARESSYDAFMKNILLAALAVLFLSCNAFAADAPPSSSSTRTETV